MRLEALTCTALLAATVAAGCGSDDPTPVAGAQPPAARGEAASRPDAPRATAAARPERSRRGTTIRLVRSQFGRILGDERGQAVYLFDREQSPRSECYGACATAWPPVYAKGRPAAASGARARLLGTTRRRGGRLQVTYRGRPLYYYVGDAPGRVLCHGVDEFGGLWLVARANGDAVPT